jgi:hypothetical protein
MESAALFAHALVVGRRPRKLRVLRLSRRFRNLQVTADLAGEMLVDFVVAWDCGRFPLASIDEHGMAPTLT